MKKYEEAEYDNKKHRWVLNELAVLNMYETNPFISDVATRRNLEDISQSIYNYIYSANRYNKILNEYLIATNEVCSDCVVEAMKAQLEAHIESGINDIHKQSGFNLEKGKAISPSTLMEVGICVQAKQILQSCSYNLMYAGKVFNTIDLTEGRYIRYGY